ncbi:uncharacterized protein TRAVEDRAFT_133412 [Trametes versicolor FP-101664 SS1]|uniref:uncharacterized protein n=1 Tax=Trametes versicolor (strain FP-101664) TaxID=717944 RepID=UPI0004623B78|nr:uncharacterized protein TRAVEDRAFT_133412 [Trametes versicolor FP-101664 SS1]EIW53792.1 hypothetical protein TRAVEDRAFT_133412 [Trametes versicolor FP-101664 SS1]
MVATYDETTGRLHGVRENADGSIDQDSLPYTAQLAVNEVTNWIYDCQEDGTIEGVVDGYDTRRWTPQGERKAPKFVRFHQFDSGKHCDEIFWEDPYTFTPRRGRLGYVDSWGIYPHDADGHREVDGMRIYERSTHLIMKPPELQFIHALMDKKARSSDPATSAATPAAHCTHHSHIPHPKDPRADRYWRRIRVSGGLPLSVFADKVLTPVWGWVRNLHAHTFHDYSDGSLFGPTDCNAVDMMHLDKSGYAYMPEEDYCLAHLLRKPGQVIGYHYDFGDNWWVDLKLEAITPPWESTGAVEVLDGAGGTPPDGQLTGTWHWADYLARASKSLSAKREAVIALFGATNYEGRLPPTLPTQYDFDAFDLQEARARVRQALDSKASMPGASKKVVTPIAKNARDDDLAVMLRLGVHPSEMKKGTVLVRTPVAGSTVGAFWEEGVRDRRMDNPGNTACAQCGSPNELKACARCKQRYYCGKACQKAHWTGGHKMECARDSSKTI